MTDLEMLLASGGMVSRAPQPAQTPFHDPDPIGTATVRDALRTLARPSRPPGSTDYIGADARVRLRRGAG